MATAGIELIGAKTEEVKALCSRYRVVKLELFGSAAGKDFDPEKSDLDFLVEFEEKSPRGAADRYFGLREDLEKVLGRAVDLVEERAITNPYFLRQVQASRAVVYAR
jgi:hypothetical protein